MLLKPSLQSLELFPQLRLLQTSTQAVRKGFGFVEMDDDAAAQAAIDALNDSEQDGRNLRVNQARPRETRD